MPKPPQPAPVDPKQLVMLAQETMRRAKFPMLATVDQDGQPRLRPVSPVKTEGFTIFVANLRDYHKTAEIAANPRVELCYMDPDHNQVRITANAEVITDPAIIADIWQHNPLLRAYLGEPTNPQLVLYRMAPNRVRYMKEWALQYHEVPLTDVA